MLCMVSVTGVISGVSVTKAMIATQSPKPIEKKQALLLKDTPPSTSIVSPPSEVEATVPTATTQPKQPQPNTATSQNKTLDPADPHNSSMGLINVKDTTVSAPDVTRIWVSATVHDSIRFSADAASTSGYVYQLKTLDAGFSYENRTTSAGLQVYAGGTLILFTVPQIGANAYTINLCKQVNGSCGGVISNTVTVIRNNPCAPNSFMPCLPPYTFQY